MESLKILETQMMETESKSVIESSKSSQSDPDLSGLTDMLSSTTSGSQTEINMADSSEGLLNPDIDSTNSFLNSILENSSNLEEFSHADSTVCSPQQNSVTDLENSQNQESMQDATKTNKNLLKSPVSKEIPDEVAMEVDGGNEDLSKSSNEKEKPKEVESVVDEDKIKGGPEENTRSELGKEKLKDSISKNLPSSSVVQSVDQNTPDEVEENQEQIKDDASEKPSSSDEAMETENHIFVQVNERSERDENKTTSTDDTQEQDEEFDNNQPQEDPIGSDDFENIAMEDENDDNDPVGDEEQGASEELCIIPDTERVISQEEKDAASIMPLRTEPTENSEGSSKQPSPEASAETEKVGDSLVTKYMATLNTDESDFTCMQCSLLRKCKYSIAGNNGGNSRYVCDESCFKTVKELYSEKLHYVGESEVRVKNLGTNSDNMIAQIKYVRQCANCCKEVMNDGMNLSWEIMEFCNEACLSKYQKKIGSNCANCNGEVKTNCLGKYSVRFGYDIRQFCSSICLEEYKKGLKACSYCQKDMSGGGDGFLAPVGDKGQFKDFCTKICMERYDRTSNNRTPIANRSAENCSVCNKKNPVSIEFELNNKINFFCGEPCFVAFKFVNNIVPGKCDMCRKYFDNKVLEENSIFYDNAQHSFCSNTCQNIYIIAQRKIVPCSWCKVKKYNFDMIKKLQGPTGVLLCSLNCYNLHQVSVNARISCDKCCKNAEPTYHLTMSDATIRNFCSHSCAVTFQNHFPKSLSSEDPTIPVPVGKPRKSKRTSQNEPSPNSDMPTMPVISSVHSLAMTNGPTSNRITRGAKNKDSAMNSYQSMKTQIKQQIIIKSAPMPIQKNMGTMCKVRQSSKGINAKPVMEDKEIQTDDVKDKTAIIPIPVPIYVPTPSCMYSLPFPIPFPFALPIPVPIFIPTTRNSATGIMKEIKKIQVKIPTDPFEAELLMMAEMVAGDKKEDNTDSESEEEDTPAPPEEVPYNPEPIEPSNTFGEDMLQMALKMATELEEPAVDLEGALTANTITASQTGETGNTEEAVDDPQPMHHLMERQPATRGRKRPGRPPKHGGPVSKRGRRSSSQLDIPLMAPPQAPQPSEPVEKPDANMCLKYTFGVNAWKQWVTTKNAELEKSTRRVKLFKPEILQLTADELNYSLCLFVKEVRKPNGQEYAPDTIYYLCLGIQQYLFENGRIDNIFCDTYYEKFTDCLDEVARKFSVLYNDSHYIVTRVEEEHLWESKQLGAHSPHVLLSTLMFFNTKHFNLTSVDEHMQLSFSHIMKHWKRNPNQPGGTNKVGGSRNVLLRFYPPQMASTQTNLNLDAATRKKKVYEQQENEENPLRCPVKLYEFYLSKCPESVKTRNDVFYLLPERSCVPDSPVWYSTMPLPRNALEKMLHRVKMVKEINVALLTS